MTAVVSGEVGAMVLAKADDRPALLLCVVSEFVVRIYGDRMIDPVEQWQIIVGVAVEPAVVK